MQFTVSWKAVVLTLPPVPNLPRRFHGRTVAVLVGGALIVMLLGLGVAWFMTSLPGPREPEVVAPAAMPDFTPSFAVLPWKRDPAVFVRVWVPLAQTPWRRTSRRAAAVILAPAGLPWVREADAPMAVGVPAATMPWGASGEHSPAVPMRPATLPRP